MKKLLLVALVLMGTATFAQVGIGTPTPSKSTMLDIVSADRGVLIPRVALTSTTDILVVKGAAAGVYTESLLVYNTATTVTGTNDVTPGYYYWTGTTTLTGVWNKISIAAANAIRTEAASYTVAATDETILVNAASAAVTITLPDATKSKGRKIYVKKVDVSGNEVTLTPTVGNIEGVASIYGAVTLQGWSLESDGSNWYVISRI